MIPSSDVHHPIIKAMQTHGENVHFEELQFLKAIVSKVF